MASDWEVATDAVLVQATLPDGGPRDALVSAAWLVGEPALAGAQPRAIWAAPQRLLYLYLHFPVARPLQPIQLAAVASTFQQAFPQAAGVQASRLSRVFDMAGASSGEAPLFHYVVETDPEAGWADEIARWYNAEHMPGLAAVPGCVRASRFINHDHGPLSYACYDLLTPETLGSEAWLAVRHTDWSSRARPHFTNTRRTMFALLRQAEASGALLKL
ncbi:MAG: hypothetical protein C0428_11995 [Polaromonas sp.]|nr:hypothetical protein [Polaromonas sp.]